LTKRSATASKSLSQATAEVEAQLATIWNVDKWPLAPSRRRNAQKKKQSKPLLRRLRLLQFGYLVEEDVPENQRSAVFSTGQTQMPFDAEHHAPTPQLAGGAHGVAADAVAASLDATGDGEGEVGGGFSAEDADLIAAALADPATLALIDGARSEEPAAAGSSRCVFCRAALRAHGVLG